MAELTLEPYAVVQHWHLASADRPWEGLLAEYLQALAQHCSMSGQSVIGHIKALALFSEGGYLRASVVSPNMPATVEGTAPPNCTDLELTLNVLVYGLKRTEIEHITHVVSEEIASLWKGDVHLDRLDQAHPHLHQPHPPAHREKDDE